MNIFALILLAVASTTACIGGAASGDAKDDAVKKELEKLAGRWQLVSSEKDGSKALEEEIRQTKFIIVGDKYTVELSGKTVKEGTFRIDPSKKPKTIDIYPTEPEAKVQMGIYEWDGQEKIRVCCTHPGTAQTRPSLFSTTKGAGHVMSVCQKEMVK
jgi:uncharacterized protein (TIGR03067 family)